MTAMVPFDAPPAGPLDGPLSGPLDGVLPGPLDGLPWSRWHLMALVGSDSARWAPVPRTTSPVEDDPHLAGELEALVAALRARSPQSAGELSRATSARHWGAHDFHDAVGLGVSVGRIRRVGHDRFALGDF